MNRSRLTTPIGVAALLTALALGGCADDGAGTTSGSGSGSTGSTGSASGSGSASH